MSPFRFARAFKKATGQSPRQYVIHRRIERAKALLRAGDQDLAQIAQRVGFSTQSHFTDVFRRLCGTTPARYRDTCRA
jgi:AraC family transcriptional regulator